MIIYIEDDKIYVMDNDSKFQEVTKEEATALLQSDYTKDLKNC